MEKVVFILNYIQAPPHAKYILRNLSGQEWVLERYFDADCQVIRQFKISSLPGDEETEFEKMLATCKKLTKTATLYVEKPTYMMTPGDVDKLFFNS